MHPQKEHINWIYIVYIIFKINHRMTQPLIYQTNLTYTQEATFENL